MKEFKFPTAQSVQAAEIDQAAHTLLTQVTESKPILQAVLAGAVIVEQDAVYVLASVNENGVIDCHVSRYVSKKEFKIQIKGCDLLREATLHLEGDWAGADDGMLRRVVFAKTNQVACDNADRTAQVIMHRPVVRNGVEVENRPPIGTVVEHEVVPRMPHSFCDLPLLATFKYINADDETTAAIKVGRSTAITGIRLDASKNVVNVATYDFKGEKVRLKKNTMVVKI